MVQNAGRCPNCPDDEHARYSPLAREPRTPPWLPNPDLYTREGSWDNVSVMMGYIRASKENRCPELQRRDFLAAGCERIFEQQILTRQADRPELWAAMGFCREGDELVVWKRDRFGRSPQEFIELVGF